MRLAGGAERVDVLDLLGRPRLREESDGTWLGYRYDEAGRLESVEHSSGERVQYEFDPETRTWSAVTDRTRTTIRIDAEGLPTELVQEVDGLRWRVGYRWRRAGRPPLIDYPQAPSTAGLEPTGTGWALRCGGREYLALTGAERDGVRTSRVDFENGAQTQEQVLAGATPALLSVRVSEPGGASRNIRYAHDERGRIVRAGSRAFAYDAGGRLIASPADSALPIELELDAVGRRTGRRGPDGETLYGYDAFGNLSEVRLPDGRSVRFLYDGFGRLVAREAGGDVRYFVSGLDGKRLVEAGSDGTVSESYLWLGEQCVGSVRGPMGGALGRSFHRIHAGHLTAVGDERGSLRHVELEDPFGSDALVEHGVPGYAGLFGDPDSRLLHAGTRWLDPSAGRFLSPDPWADEDPGSVLPGPLRRLFRSFPGGPAGRVLESEAYEWCAGDPVNRTDPLGRNWLGLIFSTISAFLWSAQETSVALQMEVINVLLEILQWFPIFRPAWDWDGYSHDSVFNVGAPGASYRLMVPFAFNLNGLLRGASNAVWTLGNIIWASGSELRDDERSSQRSLLVCSNAQEYESAANEVAADAFRVRNDRVRGRAASDAAGSTLTVTALPGAPAGATAATLFSANDFVLVRLPGGGADEVRQVSSVTAGPPATIVVPALPAAFQGQNVEWSRLDQSVVRMGKDDRRIARPVTFVRGQSIHFGRQVPDVVDGSDLLVEEFVRAPNRKQVNGVAFPAERLLLRMPNTADRDLYAAGDFVRIQDGATYSARSVTAHRGTRDLVLDSALAGGGSGLIVTKMVSAGAPAANQSARTATTANDRVEADRLTDLRPQHGLEIENTGAGSPTRERRIITGLLLDATITALPAPLVGVAVDVDTLVPDRSVRANGAMTGAGGNVITTDAGQAGRFNAGQPVRVTIAPDTHGFSVVQSVDNAANTITLDEALAVPPFVDTTPVAVALLVSTRTSDADAVVAPGDHVVVRALSPDDVVADQVIRIRPDGPASGGVVRVVQGDPTLVALLDRPLPATHTAGLTVQRFAPDDATTRSRVEAPPVGHRLTFPGAHTYVVGDVAFLQGSLAVGRATEFLVSEVVATDATSATIADFFELDMPLVNVSAVVHTSHATADGRLDKAMVIIPSAPQEDLLSRRDAVMNHEMRHVWQYAVWGPFFFSLPIPWLFHLGFSFGDRSQDVSNVVRHIGLGGLDSLIALAIWGIGGHDPEITLPGRVTDAERTTIEFDGAPDAAKVARYSSGSHVAVITGPSGNTVDTFNVVEDLQASDRKIKLRFPAERAAQGDAVQVSVSAFEQVRKTVQKLVSFNLEQLWSPHIPVAWGRALSRLLNRDSWLPLFGWYPLAMAVAGFDQRRVSFEQDASFQSGDTYTNIAAARPNEVFVGQFARLYEFQNTRFSTISQSLPNLSMLLAVQVPVDATNTAADIAARIPGCSLVPGTSQVVMQENRYVRFSDQVENAVGAFFVTRHPGDYVLQSAGALTPDQIVFQGFASTDFLKLSTLTVKPLSITPDPAQAVFETEQVTFTIHGDDAAAYGLRYAPGVAGAGRLSVRQYTAPLVAPPGSGSIQERLDVTASYDPSLGVLQGPGELAHALTAADLTNVAQELTFRVQELVAPAAVGPVAAGGSVEFEMPIAPRLVTVTSPMPAGATVNARVLMLGGRPARMRFLAPDSVPAATAVTFDMEFGADPAIRKVVSLSVQVTP